LWLEYGGTDLARIALEIKAIDQAYERCRTRSQAMRDQAIWVAYDDVMKNFKIHG
jgi:hypothetical protein